MVPVKRVSLSSLFLWGAVVLAGAYFVYLAAPAWFEEQADPRSRDFLTKVAADLNKSVPVMIDKETELLPAEVAEGMLIYNYRLISFSAAHMDPKRFAAAARQQVTQGACNRPETRDGFLKKGVTLRYTYFDKDKQHIATVDVKPSDCGF